MMTHAQLKQFIAEAILLLIVGAAMVIGSYFVSQDNANKRVQNEYHSRFDVVLDSYSYEKVKSKALNDFPEIKGVFIGYNAAGSPEGYVVDLTVTSPEGEDLSILVALDYESTRIVGLSLNNVSGDNAYVIDENNMNQIKDRLIGRQIPLAFLTEEKPDDDDTENITVPGLRDGVYYAQRLYDDRNKYIDYVEMEVQNGMITKIKWDAFCTDRTNKDRSEASLRGAYEISGLDWATQSYNLCHALLECQDPDRLAMKSDGTTDIVDGVTCDIRPFVELAQECIANSQAGYGKDQYMNGLDDICIYLFEKDAEELGYVNADGHVVFSFEKNPEIYTVYNDDEVAVGYMGVRQIQANINGTGGDETYTPDTTPDETEQGDIGNNPDNYDASDQTRTVIKACNTCYKFLKEYLNWKV